ncbi:hypothetical protein [Mycobacteroides abscessus]|uniref:hypothetical protein n=1 Tax=Mycobacteroides abscessus TaxID=36809 RepID=UPI000C256C75|nr:hypothetical protein [Mycobacteroides abscessus]
MTTTTTTPNNVRVVQIGDRDALRAHLDNLNEAGIGCSAAGIAGNGQPFLIELSGCYAETETVLWGDPFEGKQCRNMLISKLIHYYMMRDPGSGKECVGCSNQIF